MQNATPCLGPVFCYHAAFTAALHASHAGAELELRARLFCLEPDWHRGPHGLALTSSTRSAWRFHVPPNLESQYRRAGKPCQEKKASQPQNVVGILKTSPICSGVLSRTCKFLVLSLAPERKKIREVVKNISCFLRRGLQPGCVAKRLAHMEGWKNFRRLRIVSSF
jgi:hypothetical protein